MTLRAQTECCTILGIDPKTLRTWLKHAHMQFAIHPTDARLKCLTDTQVQRLATLHDRPFSSPLTPSPDTPEETQSPLTALSLAGAGVREADLGQMLLCLQAQVATMQEQLTSLALELLHERQLHTQQRLSALEALVKPSVTLSPSPPPSQEVPTSGPSDGKARRVFPSESARGRSRVLPLIASTAAGAYVVICPTHGELPFSPETPEWFEWLTTLHSFRFLGQQGRLSTYRNPGKSCWIAYRRIHGHRYEYALGHTERLTIAHLEQMAATLQSHATDL
jgi:hypothetical protein